MLNALLCMQRVKDFFNVASSSASTCKREGTLLTKYSTVYSEYSRL